MRFGSTAIHADFFQDTKYRVYMTSIRIQNKDSNEEVLPSDPSVWSMNWDCIDSLTEIFSWQFADDLTGTLNLSDLSIASFMLQK